MNLKGILKSAGDCWEVTRLTFHTSNRHAMISPLQAALLDSIGVDSNDHSLYMKVCTILHDYPTKLMEASLETVERGKIIEMRAATNGRRFWKVRSTEGSTEYVVLKMFCPCRSFSDMWKHCDSKVDNHLPLCKHLLAVRFATAMNKVAVMDVSDEEFVRIISQG